MGAIRTDGLTFLFTDIEGSTSLWERHPDAMATALSQHDEILRTAIGEHGGSVFKSTGDGVGAVFTRPRAALDAALAARKALRGVTWGASGMLRVRMGIHSGSAEPRDGDYYGQTVNRVARLMAAARGSQILASEIVIRGIQGDVPDGAVIKSLGEWLLKDIPEPFHVFDIRLIDDRSGPAADDGEDGLGHDQPSAGVSSGMANVRSPATVGPTELQTILPLANETAGLRIEMLGGFRVRYGDRSIAPDQWHRRKARQLFKCLLTRPNHRLLKDEIFELFWPDSDPEAAKQTIRPTVHALRRALESTGLTDAATLVVVDDAGIGLRADTGLWIDANAFERLAEWMRRPGVDDELLEAADRLYRGTYLPDDIYEPWTEQRRESLHRQWTDLQMRLGRARVDRGDLEGAIDPFERLLHDDPANEPAALDLMRLYARQRRTLDALRVYDRLEQALRHDFKVDPSPETREFRDQLLVAPPASAPGASTPPTFPPQPATPRGPSRPDTLPVPGSALIGRNADMDAVRALIRAPGVRLVTLTGPGGTGKTRLALEIGAELADAFRQGVYFVDLTPIADDDLVIPAIARTLDVRETAGRTIAASLHATLRPKQILLILDNFEQVVGAASQVARMLAACPEMKVLVTSRAVLRIAGERVHDVRPLAPPAAGPRLTFSAVAASPAVQLFVERARGSRPDFALTRENAGYVAAICRQIDGLPLAIELAAARISLLTPKDMLKRLKPALPMLGGGTPDRPARHKTIRETIAWSYDLLSEGEKRLLGRLAVFAGGCQIDAIEAISSADDTTTPPWVVDDLESLIAKSLVRCTVEQDQPRFSLLAVIREYALEQLEASGEAETIRARHVRWCLAFTGADRPPDSFVFPTRSASSPSSSQLEREHQNLHTALRRLIRSGRGDDALKLAVALFDLWYDRGYFRSGRERLREALGLASADAHPVIRAYGLWFGGVLSRYAGVAQESQDFYQNALAIFRELEHREGQAQVLATLAQVASEEDDLPAARGFHDEALAVAHQLGDPRTLAWALHGRGQLAEREGDRVMARELHQQCLAIRRELGNLWAVSWSLIDLAYLALDEGDGAGARLLLAECPALRGDDETPPAVAAALECAGALAVLEDRTADALRLLGAASALRDATGASPAGRLRLRVTSCLRLARGQYSTVQADAIFASGRALASQQAVRLALGDPKDQDGAALRSRMIHA